MIAMLFSSPHGTRRDLGFERERYVKIDTSENCMYWAFSEVFILFDEKRFFISCSKCLVEIKSKVKQVKRFEDGRHDECFYQLESYLDERVSREIRGEYIYYIRGLCKDCVFEYFSNIKGDLITYFHLNVCNC